MNIQLLFFGVLFLGCTIALFYFITLLIQKIVVKIHNARRIYHDNTFVNSDNTTNNINNVCGNNAGKAILNAKEKMRKDK